MSLVIQTILAIIIMAAMVMILLSIGRLAKGNRFDDPETTRNLRHEIEEKDSVLTHNNAFNYLMGARESVRNSSNGPSSRKL